jgi:hypothetical protein
MGSMSASDAAPLPRLGEVFFDVRGESRTMRLSWYADTGVAVFSIWQGGTCTGTFRLPIPDLPRMVEALQRGPHVRDDLVTGEQPASHERRPPTVPAQRGPARPSRQEFLNGDIATGQSAAAVYPPPDVTGYEAGPPLAGYPGGPPPPGHPDPPGLGYPPGLSDPAEEFTAGYAGGPSPDFAAERGPQRSRPPTGRRSGGHRAPAGYPEDPQPYPGEPGGYASDPPGGYSGEPGAGYADEPANGYPGDDTQLAPGYPDEPEDYRRYRDDLPAAGYDPPGPPYVTDTGDIADDIAEPFADDPPERRKPRGRRRAGPAPDSFPYGPPPSGDEPRERGHYPGRH